MKRKTPVGKLIASLAATGALLHILTSSPSPTIVLLPFLICALAMAGKSIAQILGKEKMAAVFHKTFVAGFLLFWFGFLAVAGYIAIRDKTYSLLFLIVPFCLVGFLITKNRLLGGKTKTDPDLFRFAHAVSTVLVSIVLLAGVLLLILGVRREQLAILFMGAFFLLGGGAFAVGTLTLRGVFDNAKINVMGLYVGIVFVFLGIGFTVMILILAEPIGLWILIPLLMTAAGVLQSIKCLRNKK